MAHSPEEMLALAADIERDQRRASAKLVELARMLATLPTTPPDASAPRCDKCGPLPTVRSAEQLIEHQENVHGELAPRPSEDATTLAPR